MEIVISVIILIFSVVIHEVAHGYAALYYGDKTALYAGRLTLNPIKHLDLWGSVIIPLLLVISQAGFIIGWAKPVPYNPNNLRNPRRGSLWVAAAGPLSNLSIALVFGICIRVLLSMTTVAEPILTALSLIVFINLILALFNLIPIPPLDGSKILFSLLPARYGPIMRFLEQYGIILLLLFIFVAWRFVAPVIFTVFHWFTGISF